MLEIEPRPLGMLDMDFTNLAIFIRQFFCIGTHSVDETTLDWPPECWDQGCAPPVPGSCFIF